MIELRQPVEPLNLPDIDLKDTLIANEGPQRAEYHLSLLKILDVQKTSFTLLKTFGINSRTYSDYLIQRKIPNYPIYERFLDPVFVSDTIPSLIII